MLLFDNVPIWVKGAKQMQCCCSTMYRFEFALQLYVRPLGLHWASFMSWPWHKGIGHGIKLAQQRLLKCLMKTSWRLCNPWWRSIISCEELKLSPARWERSPIFFNPLFIMLKKSGQGLYAIEVGAKVFQSSHPLCFAYSWDFCSKNKLSII